MSNLIGREGKTINCEPNVLHLAWRSFPCDNILFGLYFHIFLSDTCARMDKTKECKLDKNIPPTKEQCKDVLNCCYDEDENKCFQRPG